MPTLAEVTDELERLAPLRLAADWDTVGLLIGGRRARIERVMTCLTLTERVAAEAVAERADLVVVHHPLPFRPLGRITTATGTGRVLLALIESGVSLWSPHTAWDSAAGGINDQLAAILDLERVVPLDAVSRKETVSTSPSEIPLADFPKARVDQIGLIGQIQELAAAKVAIGMFTGRLEQTTPVAVEGERQQTKLATTRLNRIIMEPWRRWANGFSCLCFVLVGAPMAIRMRNADFLTSFFLCFLPILVVYYPVFMLGISRVKAGVMPPPAVWMGNVLITLWGLWLLRRVVRG